MSNRVVYCKPSSNGARADGTSMNVGNKLSARPSVRLYPQYSSGSALQQALFGGVSEYHRGYEYTPGEAQAPLEKHEEDVEETSERTAPADTPDVMEEEDVGVENEVAVRQRVVEAEEAVVEVPKVEPRVHRAERTTVAAVLQGGVEAEDKVEDQAAKRRKSEEIRQRVLERRRKLAEARRLSSC